MLSGAKHLLVDVKSKGLDSSYCSVMIAPVLFFNNLLNASRDKENFHLLI